jgi:hypothetical protein
MVTLLFVRTHTFGKNPRPSGKGASDMGPPNCYEVLKKPHLLVIGRDITVDIFMQFNFQSESLFTQNV